MSFPELQNTIRNTIRDEAFSRAEIIRAILLLMILFSARLEVRSDETTQQTTIHDRLGWSEDHYFTDPKTRELCRAIEAKDLDRVRAAVEAGANVNDLGLNNMNPLLWAFMDGKLEILEYLLQQGADPNIAYQDHFGFPRTFWKGMTLVNMGAKSEFKGFFETILRHGGDPNTLDIRDHTSLYSQVIKSPSAEKLQRIRLLIDSGASMEVVSSAGMTPVTEAVLFAGQYEIALLMLQHGADYKRYHERQNTKLIHHVVMEEDKLRSSLPDRAESYYRLLNWLERHGETREEALRDLKVWRSWSIYSPKEQEFLFRKQREERLAKERDALQETRP